MQKCVENRKKMNVVEDCISSEIMLIIYIVLWLSENNQKASFKFAFDLPMIQYTGIFMIYL